MTMLYKATPEGEFPPAGIPEAGTPSLGRGTRCEQAPLDWPGRGDDGMLAGVEAANAQSCASMGDHQEAPAHRRYEGIITTLEGGLAKRLLPWALSAFKVGSIRLIDSSGQEHTHTGSRGPSVAVRLHDPALPLKLLANPWLNIGEAYMDGTLTIEKGTLGDVLEICLKNAALLRDNNNPMFRLITDVSMLRMKLTTFLQSNGVVRARQNVAHHYDLSDKLYELFLDVDRQYSCAYFLSQNDSLETAQENKKRHIAAKLLLTPGQKVLDIGSGWGGLALHLARECDVDITGLTLSDEQHRKSEEGAQREGLADRVRFKQQDYREETGIYDRIVSVGMFEHVGAQHFREFFSKLRSLLADDGVALLHSIGRMKPPGNTNPWLAKYIFPGGYSPALSEVLAAVEKERLYVTDVEILRGHYQETLKQWYDRFQANRPKIAELYDERFCRMWEFYLKSCEMAFRYWHHMVFQMQLTKHQDAVPFARNYITYWERAYASAKAEEESELVDSGALSRLDRADSK